MPRLIFLVLVLIQLADAGPVEDARKAVAAKQFEKARELLKQPAADGDAGAQVLLAQLLRDGKGGKTNARAAAALLKSAAEFGLPVAHLQLGHLYRQGIGVGMSHGRALKRFRLAGSAGNVEARFWAQRLLFESRVVGRDRAAAEKALLAMAERGYSAAVVYFPMEAYQGRVPKIRPAGSESLPWERALKQFGPKLANAGSADAQFCMGWYLQEFNLIDVSGLRWLEKAAASGHMHAQYYLGSSRYRMKLLADVHLGDDALPGAKSKWAMNRSRELLEAAALQGHADAAHTMQSTVGPYGDLESRPEVDGKRLAWLWFWEYLRTQLRQPLTREERQSVKHHGYRTWGNRIAKARFAELKKLSEAGVKKRQLEEFARTGVRR